MTHIGNVLKMCGQRIYLLTQSFEIKVFHVTIGILCLMHWYYQITVCHPRMEWFSLS